ncbi:glycosyltransferase family 2 protein [Patescibacteria group bacterium]|nr:glycosyltransferase family 2 protein [Patescibacteria group bacterium]
MRYSVVVPAHNEEESIRPLYQAVRGVMEGLDGQWELLFINDGSQDKTGEIIEGIVEQDNHVKLISFRRQFGQTAAWSAGFDYASGDYVVVLDADLQNDPKDIPMLIEKIKEGYNVGYPLIHYLKNLN